MARLFDSGKEEQQAATAGKNRQESRRRADEAEEALKELVETDEASLKLAASLAAARAVAPVVYKEYRRPGYKWMIEHSVVGEDYIFQLHPLRPIAMSKGDVLALAINAMDVIFPRSLDIRYVPPSDQFKIQFYTIRVEKVVGRPGWTDAIDRALASLAAIEAWPKKPKQG
jgi:hypothetical protein